MRIVKPKWFLLVASAALLVACEPAAKADSAQAALEEIVDAEIASLLAQRPALSPRTIDHTGSMSDPSIRIIGGAAVRGNLDADAAALVGGQTGQRIEPGPFLFIALDLGAEISDAEGIQFGVGLSASGEPWSTPDPVGLGLGASGLSHAFVVDGLDGCWQAATALDPPRGYARRPETNAFAMVHRGESMITFAIPVREFGATSAITGMGFRRSTAGEQTNLVWMPEVDFPSPDGNRSGTCAAPDYCLGGGRFRIDGTFRRGDMVIDPVGVRTFDGDFGLGLMFGDGDDEVEVHLTNGCSINEHFWFRMALTDISYTLTVTDTQADVERAYDNLSSAIQPIMDTSAFATCP